MSYDFPQAAHELARRFPQNVKRKIRGKFWMVQSHIINPAVKDDRFGRATVEWPGRSVFSSRADALTCAEALAKQHTNHAFFVMEAVEMVSVNDPERVQTKREAL